MKEETGGTNWIDEYLHWNDQGHRPDGLPRGHSAVSGSRSGEPFVAAYLEWIEVKLPQVRPDIGSVLARKPRLRRPKRSRPPILDRPMRPSLISASLREAFLKARR